MPHSRLAVSSVLLAALLISPAGPATADVTSPDAATPDTAVPLTQPGETGRYLVQYAPGTDVAAEAKGLGARKMKVTRTYTKVLRGAAVSATPEQAAALRRSPRVLAVEPDAQVSAAETQQSPPWGLDRIDQRTLPLSATYTPAASGLGVTAYVIDSGVLSSHAEFGSRVAAGWTEIKDGHGTNDCNGHGTHVAGTIAGRTYGAAKAATVVPVRVLDCEGTGKTSDLIAGLEWIASTHPAGKPAVVNLSLSSQASNILDAAVRNIIDAGFAATVAAGNASSDACDRSPARVAEALTVAASDPSDLQAPFSNFGSCVDLYAPGTGVRSASHTSTTSTATMSGTSMATPHVAGAAAALLTVSPQLTPGELAGRLLSQATENVIGNATAGTPNRLLFTGAPASAPPAASIQSAADILAAGTDGVLWNYRANGQGGLLPRVKIGQGWYGLKNGFVTDWNQDGVFDVIAQWKDGRLSYYQGKAAGGLAPGLTIGTGWGSYQVTVGRWRTTDQFPGIVAYDSTGALWHYPNTSGKTVGSGNRVRIGGGWNGLYNTMADFDQDGAQDILAKRSDGVLLLYRSNGTGSFLSETRRAVGGGWNTINSITRLEGFQGTATYGLMARLTDGRLAYYPVRKGTWGTRTMPGGGGWGPYNIFR